jgi:4'-phosphopantetheinyl transferase
MEAPPRPRVEGAASAAGAVDVWLIRWRACLSQLRQSRGSLSADEWERASRFVFVRDRMRFLTVRAALRAIAAERLGIPARDVRFAYGRWGKPGFPPLDHPPLHFSVSHAGACSIVALSDLAPIGIDIEQVRHVGDEGAVARMFCSAVEVAAMQALSPAERQRALLIAWTRRESILKGLGYGLHRSPREVVISSAHGDQPVDLLGLPADTDRPEAWSIRPLELPDCLVGTLAVRHRGWTVRGRAWPVATDGNGFGPIPQFSRPRDLRPVATGCNHGAP